MTLLIESPIFRALRDGGGPSSSEKNQEIINNDAAGSYWWSTSGRDLSNMLHEAKYPEDVQRQFLSYFRDTICPILGPKPSPGSQRCLVGWDGNPFEYSFELRSNSKSQTVRFVVDLTQLRPVDKDSPLSMANTQKALDELAKTDPDFDDTWYRSLSKYFGLSDQPLEKQEELIRKAGYQSAVILGFDISRKLLSPGQVPVRSKIYFPLCFAAAERGITRWEATRLGIRQLPEVESYPNILRSLEMIEEYVAGKPQDWQEGSRYLATDFVAPAKQRLKVYMRYAGTSFEDLWDFYTLGGRIPGLDEDREKFQDLIDFLSGSTFNATMKEKGPPAEPYTNPEQKRATIYFSLSADSPLPAPKLLIYSSNFAPNDEVIVRGLDTWLSKYKWDVGSKSIEDQVKSVFTHRELKEKTGIFTFMGIGRKEDPTKKDLSIQVYVTPELYENPRF